MNVETIENQVNSLLSSVAELQQKVSRLEQKPNAHWLKSVLGRFQNDPDFDEAMEQAKALRETGGFPDDTPRDQDAP